jgi:oxygen-dependent protoporphyrinogen oxidase
VVKNQVHVAVVGGGLSGLVAAGELARSGARVTVLEQRDRFGGQVHTERTDGFVVEHGAEGFIARSEAVRELCGELGLSDRIVSQQTRRALLARDGALSELGAGEAARILGIPAAADDLGQGLSSLRGGMGELVEALLASLRGCATFRPRTPVLEISRESAGWLLQVANGPGITADAVVLALPPDGVLRTVRHLPSDVANPLPGLATNAVLCLSLAFARERVAHPLDASGVVFAEPQADRLTACTFSSSKFPHRSPSGTCLLRVFFRPPEDELLQNHLDMSQWIQRALEGLAPLGIEGRPSRVWSAIWRSVIPRYSLDYTPEIDSLRRAVQGLGAVELAGAFYAGPGVDGAVRSGMQAARSLLRGKLGA